MLGADDLRFFDVLAGCSTLAEAARKLEVTPPAVTQRLQALEARVGLPLVDRSGRRLALTDEGRLVASHGLRVAEAMASLAEALAARRQEVGGHLRIGAPHGFGRLHVAPVVDAFARAHPGATVMLELSDQPGAAQRDRCDLLVCIGAPEGLGAEFTTLAPNRRLLCASPQYLAAAPAIQSPQDLLLHRCLVVRGGSDDAPSWPFVHATRPPQTVRIRPTLASNDGAVVRSWALSGQGVALRSEWNVAADLADGRLKRVLGSWELPPADVVAVAGGRAGRSAGATAFLAMLRESLSPAPWRRRAGR